MTTPPVEGKRKDTDFSGKSEKKKKEDYVKRKKKGERKKGEKKLLFRTGLPFSEREK